MPHNKIEDNILLDYYGDLLTNHQKEILNEYLNEDLSMNEIADNYKISKSAVQDLIKRSIIQMQNFEKVLKIIEKDRKLDIVIEEMKKENKEILDKYINRIEKLK